MGIARSVRPTVLVAGGVVRVKDLLRKADKARYGTEIVIAQDSGAQVAVTVYDSAGLHALPAVGEFFVAECSVEESRDFGASLSYETNGVNLLDQIHSALSVSGK